MFQCIHAVAMYSSELQASVARHRALGLEVAWTEEEDGCTRVGLRCPQGGAQLILHDDIARQFTEMTVAVADVHSTYQTLRNEPGYLWFEAPHHTKQGCAAFVRTPDGNVLSLLSPGCDCDGRQPARQDAPIRAGQEARAGSDPRIPRAFRPQV